MAVEVLERGDLVAIQVEMNNVPQIERRQRFELVVGKVKSLQIWEHTCIR